MAICACLLIGAVLILGCSIFTTIYYKMHQENDKLYFKAENIPLLVISVGLSLLVFYIFKKKEIFTKNKKLMAIGLLFCILYCLILIFSIKPMPVNDSGLLDAHINSFVRGDYSQLTEKGGYLYTWPFQFFLQCIFWIRSAWSVLKMRRYVVLCRFYPWEHCFFTIM